MDTKNVKNVEQPEVAKKETDVEINADVVLPADLQKQVTEHAKELKKKLKLRKVYAVVIQGEDEEDKPYYIAYFRRPGLMPFSQYMNFVQKDVVQANKNLASNIFIEGDRELIDDEELFIFGLMQRLGGIIESLDGKLVKA